MFIVENCILVLAVAIHMLFFYIQKYYHYNKF